MKWIDRGMDRAGRGMNWIGRGIDRAGKGMKWIDHGMSRDLHIWCHLCNPLRAAMCRMQL